MKYRVKITLNRTILELKLKKVQDLAEINQSLNRTILELKQWNFGTNDFEVSLLIAPFWN